MGEKINVDKREKQRGERWVTSPSDLQLYSVAFEGGALGYSN